MRGRRSRTALALAATLALGGGGVLALTLTEGAPPTAGPAEVVAPTSTTAPTTSAPRPTSRPARLPAHHRPRRAGHPTLATRPSRPARGTDRPAIDPRRVLIRFAPDVSAAERAAARRATGARVVGILGPQRIEVWRIPRGRSVSRVLARYRRDHRIALAAPNRRYTTSAVPDDPSFGAQWGLDNTGQPDIQDEETSPPAGIADQDLDAPEAFDALGLGGVTGPYPRLPGFTIGIVDTGVYAQHDDLAGKVVGCVSAVSTTTVSPGCADDNGHGTHVSGIAAATTNNGRGIAGVAPDAGIYMCKALGAKGDGDDIGIITCINDIVAHRTQYGIHVLSMSLGGTGRAPAGQDPLENAIEDAYRAGVLVVAAAGNEYGSGVPPENPLEFPAGYASVVSVGASDRRGQRSSFSEVNSDVEVSAPGTAIASTWPFDRYGNADPSAYIYLDGTSMATPAAAAVAATIAARRPSFTSAQVRGVLDRAVDDLGAAGRDNAFGFGRVNLAKAIALTPATTPTTLTTPTTPSTRTTPLPRAPASLAFVPTGYLAFAGRPVRGLSALTRLRADDGRRLEVGSVRRGRSWTSDLRVTISTKRSTKAVLKRLSLLEDGNVSRPGASRRVSVYDWAGRRWVSVGFLRRAAGTDRRVRWTTTSRPARFVSQDGLLRARVTATGARGLRTRTDLVRFTLGY